MTDAATPKRKPIEGRPVLVVIDIQQSAFVEKEVRSIPHMPDYAARVARTRFAIDRARGAGIPIVFIQEIHRADLVDFGRELDGGEGVHCLDNNPETALAREAIDFRDGDYLVQKRRYSAFYGADLEILLRGLRADTLLLAGGLADVCVHYTFVDGRRALTATGATISAAWSRIASPARACRRMKPHCGRRRPAAAWRGAGGHGRL